MPAIRLIGEHHTTDRDGAVLTIADEAVARVNPNTVTLEHARNLVAWGQAEWVDEPEEPQMEHRSDDQTTR
jgi:hypothetical protein